MFIVELAETDCHLAAAGTGGGDDDERTRGLHIIVASEALLGVNEVDIGWIAVDYIVVIGGDAHALKLLTESFGAALAVVVGDNH